MPARGSLIVISAPSGAGKTTLVRRLLERLPELRFSISHTTRPKRKAEVDGSDYFFVTEDEFRKLRDDGEFLESARVFDHSYGTGRRHVEALLARGHTVLMEIDWQGAAQVRAAVPEATGIFVLPPSRDELERRLRGRATDSDAVIRRRLRDAVSDMAHWPEFDYVVINTDIDRAADALVRIIGGEGDAHRTDAVDVRARIEQALGL